MSCETILMGNGKKNVFITDTAMNSTSTKFLYVNSAKFDCLKIFWGKVIAV